MARTHYEVLGVKLTSTAAEIRSAYRKLVLQHHPDRSPDPKSKALFLAATEAYEILGDPEARRNYDARLEIEKRVRAANVRSAPAPQPARPTQAPQAKSVALREEVNRLSTLFSRGRFVEAETLARSILDKDFKQPIPYAVLGDLARQKGQMAEALKMYAYAAQFEPKNPVYQRRYEELLNSPRAARAQQTRYVPEPARKSSVLAPILGGALLITACVYLALSKENAFAPSVGVISTWTLGLVGMLFFGGVVVGSTMASTNFLDEFRSLATNAVGRTSPTLALASIAVISFWGAVLMYAVLGFSQKGFNFSTSRLMSGCAGAVAMFALAAEANGHISGIQVFLWGGNLIYLGAICGWMVTDALKGA